MWVVVMHDAQHASLESKFGLNSNVLAGCRHLEGNMLVTRKMWVKSGLLEAFHLKRVTTIRGKYEFTQCYSTGHTYARQLEFASALRHNALNQDFKKRSIAAC